MIRGLDIFRQRFSDFEGTLVLIGGAACDDWFTRQGLSFRATKDLDIVLLLEAVNPDFIAAMRQFIADGGYEIRQRKGEKIDAKDINKHLADIFRLAGTLPGEAGPSLAQSIRQDISSFLQRFPEDAPEWPAILASIKPTLGGNLKPALLTNAIQTYFQLE